MSLICSASISVFKDMEGFLCHTESSQNDSDVFLLVAGNKQAKMVYVTHSCCLWTEKTALAVRR